MKVFRWATVFKEERKLQGEKWMTQNNKRTRTSGSLVRETDPWLKLSWQLHWTVHTKQFSSPTAQRRLRCWAFKSFKEKVTYRIAKKIAIKGARWAQRTKPGWYKTTKEYYRLMNPHLRCWAAVGTVWRSILQTNNTAERMIKHQLNFWTWNLLHSNAWGLFRCHWYTQGFLTFKENHFW